MTQQESQTAILVAAEALLRAAGWPATRGQPSVAVPIVMRDPVLQGEPDG